MEKKYPISGSNYETNLSSLGEIIVFCSWLQRSILYSSMPENMLCVTVQNKIFDVKCVVSQEQFFYRALTIIASFGVTENLTISKIVYRQNFWAGSKANFYDASEYSVSLDIFRVPNVLKGTYQRSRTRSTSRED